MRVNIPFFNIAVVCAALSLAHDMDDDGGSEKGLGDRIRNARTL